MIYYAIPSSVHISQAEDAAVLKAAVKPDIELVLCKNKDDAKLMAISLAAETPEHAYPILEVSINGTTGRQRFADDDIPEGVTGDVYKITPNKAKDFVILSGSMEHFDAKFKTVDLTAVAAKAKDKQPEEAVKAEDKKPEGAAKVDDKKPEETAKKSIGNKYTITASVVAGVAVVSTGFWFSGFYPAAIALLAKAGYALPAAAIGVQVGVSLAVGAIVVGFASLAYYGFNKLFAIEAAVDTRTEDQKYHDELKAAEENVKSNSEKLTAEHDKNFLKALNTILDVEHTQERKFEKDGKPTPTTDQPAANDKLIVLKYEATKLAEVVAAKGDARKAQEAKILEAAKADSAKKFAI